MRNALPHVVSSPLVIPLSFPVSDFCVCVRVSLPSLSAQLLSHSYAAPPSVSVVWLPPTSFVLLGYSASLLCAESGGCLRLKGAQRGCHRPPAFDSVLGPEEAALPRPRQCSGAAAITLGCVRGSLVTALPAGTLLAADALR